jgi:glutathione S-transferase
VLPILHPSDQATFRATRESRFGAKLEDLHAKHAQKLPAVRTALTPLRITLARQPFLGGNEPSYADYAVFGCFQWARCVGAPDLLAPDDPLNTWREEMLDLFDGLARRAKVAR